MNDVKCPYCGSDEEINHDDGQGYSEDDLHQQECGVCNKTFTFTTFIHFSYDVFKADCLNDGEHVWKLAKAYPERFSRMRCDDCWAEKPLCDQDRIAFGIINIDAVERITIAPINEEESK